MARLTSLVRKELVRPDKSELPGEDAFRFRHLLVRDAAYDALPKATRAELHERFAGWLVENGRDLVELDEILGYHLEQACRYRAELGVAADARWPGRRGSGWRPPAAGHLSGSDSPAAVNLLQRAAALFPSDEIDRALMTDLWSALFQSGRLEDAVGLAGDVVAQAAAAGDRGRRAVRADRAAGSSARILEPEGAVERLAATIEEAIARLPGSRGRFRALHRLLRARAGREHARQDGRNAGRGRARGRACESGGRPPARGASVEGVRGRGRV